MYDHIRERGISFEKEHHKFWIERKVSDYNPHRTLQHEISQYLEPSQTTYRILDVGCGPISTLGTTYEGKSIELIGIDPLTQYYQELLSQYDIHLTFEPIQGEGERLLDYFAPNSFDLVYSRNALDHSHDPYEAIKAMLTVCKPKSYVVFSVFKNEGLNSGYVGFHQWNFTPVDQSLLIWSMSKAHLLDECINGLPYKISEQTVHNKEMLTCTIYKCDTSPSCMSEIHHGLYLNIDKKANSICLFKEDSFSCSERFFVHLKNKNSIQHKFSFIWNLEIPMKSFFLPEVSYDEIFIGQYAMIKENESHSHTRFWGKSIHV
ncbi:class I SAM-dependent methyltransferase [Desulfovibrio sp. OttesenSCG-928-C06]|nr:class I SAM-dependent methyltransferase [Desulfovibrio sp. OttesenSCG-928-C06]